MTAMASYAARWFHRKLVDKHARGKPISENDRGIVADFIGELRERRAPVEPVRDGFFDRLRASLGMAPAASDVAPGSKKHAWFCSNVVAGSGSPDDLDCDCEVADPPARPSSRGTAARGQTIDEKVAHVRRSGQSREHGCHWPGCMKQVPPAKWGCSEHWYRLPKPLRDRIWREYRTGQEQTLSPSREYMAVLHDVDAWIAEYNAKRGIAPPYVVSEPPRRDFATAKAEARRRDVRREVDGIMSHSHAEDVRDRELELERIDRQLDLEAAADDDRAQSFNMPPFRDWGDL